MGVIGTWHETVFEISQEKILSFGELDHSAGARLEVSEIINSEPVVEFGGPQSETVGLNIVLMADLGVNPEAEYEKLHQAVRAGLASSLVIGGKPFGGSGVKWIIESLSGKMSKHSAGGKPRNIEAGVSFRRYKTVG